MTPPFSPIQPVRSLPMTYGAAIEEPRPLVAGGGGEEGPTGAVPVDSHPQGTNEIHGDLDGSPIRLSSGVVIELRRVGAKRVTTAELLAAIRGIQLLPVADQQLIARAGVKVDLVPLGALEQTQQGKDLLGATTILKDQKTGTWYPSLVRVAVSAGRTGHEATPEIVQHELGHVVSVLTRQDGSEQAADAYASLY